MLRQCVPLCRIDPHLLICISHAQRLAQPLLEEMTAAGGPATLKVGVQIRAGDAKLANAPKKGDRRYPPGCVELGF